MFFNDHSFISGRVKEIWNGMKQKKNNPSSLPASYIIHTHKCMNILFPDTEKMHNLSYFTKEIAF